MPLKSYEIEGAIRITELLKIAGCDIDRMEIFPETQMRPHFHQHFDEVFYVESGGGICQLGEKKFPIQAGDLLSLPKKRSMQ